MSLDKGEKPILPAKVSRGDTPLSLAAISQSGRLLVFPLDELKVMAKGRGLIIQDVDSKDALAGVAVGTTAFVITGTGRGGKTVGLRVAGKELEAARGARARRGQLIQSKIKPTRIDPH